MIYLILDIILVVLALFLGFWFRGKWDEMFKHDPKIDRQEYHGDPIYPDREGK